eukprot:scaffold47327_cov46-Attheya_sp.AAC.3
MPMPQSQLHQFKPGTLVLLGVVWSALAGISGGKPVRINCLCKLAMLRSCKSANCCRGHLDPGMVHVRA